MKILHKQFLLVVLILTPVCLAAPGVGEFFEKLFGVFKPEGIVVTDAPGNETDSAESNDTVVELGTETVITELDNDTEVIHAKLSSVVVEKLTDSGEMTTEDTSDEDTTSSTTPTTTTTVVYKLFHPDTTTTATTASDPTTTTITQDPKSDLSTTAISDLSTSAITQDHITTQHSTETTNAETTVVTSTESSAPEGRAVTQAPSLASTAIVNNVLCKTTYNAQANLKITSCSTSSTTPKANRKRSADDYNVVPVPLADTIQNSSTPDESYPSSSEVGDDDGDVFPWDGDEQSATIITYG